MEASLQDQSGSSDALEEAELQWNARMWRKVSLTSLFVASTSALATSDLISELTFKLLVVLMSHGILFLLVTPDDGTGLVCAVLLAVAAFSFFRASTLSLPELATSGEIVFQGTVGLVALGTIAGLSLGSRPEQQLPARHKLAVALGCEFFYMSTAYVAWRRSGDWRWMVVSICCYQTFFAASFWVSFAYQRDSNGRIKRLVSACMSLCMGRVRSLPGKSYVTNAEPDIPKTPSEAWPTRSASSDAFAVPRAAVLCCLKCNQPLYVADLDAPWVQCSVCSTVMALDNQARNASSCNGEQLLRHAKSSRRFTPYKR